MTEYVLKVDGKKFPLPTLSRDFCNTIHEVGSNDDSFLLEMKATTKEERLKFIADHHTKENGILYGEWGVDKYFIIERNDKMYVVHQDYFGYTSAVLFVVGGDDHEATDWSDVMLFEAAKEVVDGLNRLSGYPYAKDDDDA